MNDPNPQDDWQRQVDTINIQLKHLTKEPDSKPQDPTNSDKNDPPQESYYELLREAPDNYSFPYLSMQLKPDTQAALRQSTPLFEENTYTLHPGETLAAARRMPHLLDHDAAGKVTPSAQFGNHDSIFITSSFSTINNNAIGCQITVFSELPHTITCDALLADFKTLTPNRENM